jgi:CheY-like chemotaxis protein
LPADPQFHRLLDNALMGARRGATLTQRMLAFARRQDLDVTPLDLKALVTGMADLLASSLGSSVEIKTAFPQKLALAVGDENQVELALLNLCVNARDAMPEGGEIVIGAREETLAASNPTGLKPGRYLCLSVTDTGEGMSQETLARASEPFFTTKGVGRGTGLGLSMVHGMAEQMGGRLMLKSVLGKGTTAEIWLQALEGESSAASAPTSAIAASAAPRRLKVLAVDDDRLVLFNTTAMLEDLGHEAVEAGSADEALDLMDEHRFDLVITDQAMPRMTGVQLLDVIRQRQPDMPVILATGYAEIPGGGQVSAPKLNKPFTEKELDEAVRAATQAGAPVG